MAGLVPNASEVTLLKYMLGVETPNNQIIKLFVNDVTPTDTDVAGSYTEMSTHGYANKTLTKTSWAVATESNIAKGEYAQQTWTFTAATAVVVYGYFIVDSSTGLLLCSERFTDPKTVQFNGDQIIITPKITLSKV